VPTPARLAASLGGRLPHPGARIGLLGGSFNPAHAGHRHISLEAKRRLGLDQVWWLVSPQNPLKAADGMASQAERLAGARRLACGKGLLATDIETVLGTRYTADTLRALQRRFPKVNFVWLMGADNLIQIDRWEDWQRIFHCLPVAVLARPTYSLRASRSKAAERFKAARWAEREVQGLAEATPPAWTFLHIRLSPLSATRIRAAGKAGRTPGFDATETRNRH
jgi:nicotinate-nucleotide adenylyltransferase